MRPPHFRISSETFKNNICDGFSRQQQNEEFVDMTLAAGGYMVKAHRNIIALSSPYLKHLMNSTPAQHPVIFLNGVSHEILSYLLEYIYTGEVKIPPEKLDVFVQAAKSLYITGVKDLDLLKNHSVVNNKPKDTDKAEPARISACTLLPNDSKSIAANIIINKDDHTVQVNRMQNNLVNESAKSLIYNVIDDITDLTDLTDLTDFTADETNRVLQEDNNTYHTQFDNFLEQQTHTETNIMDMEMDIVPDLNNPEPTASAQVDGSGTNTATYNIVDEITEPEDLVNTARYSMSKRGALQIIIDKYIYYIHHKTKDGRKKRWRCLYYRSSACQAFFDCVDGILTESNMNCHNHLHHNKTIAQRERSNTIFSTVKEAKNYLLSKQSLDSYVSDYEEDISVQPAAVIDKSKLPT